MMLREVRGAELCPERSTWAPGTDGASGATGYRRVDTDQKVAGFVLGKAKLEKEVMTWG